MIGFVCLARSVRLIAIWAAAMAMGRASTPIFRDGQRLVSIVVAADAAPPERAAAEELARVLGLMSGLSWSVDVEDHSSRRGFFVGRTREGLRHLPALKVAVDLLAPAANEIGPDGFRIQTTEGDIFIEGATPEATEYAVSWLLQREAGVRWYVPGAIGEVIPRRFEWVLPDIEVTREPAYVSREIYDLNNADARIWGRRNGLRGRLEFNHAFNHVFSPRDLAENLNWAPVVRGEHYVPVSSDDYHWQPNLAHHEVAAHAARAVFAAFARDPGRVSFSLAMNDSVRFDQSPLTRAVVEPLRYFRGQPDYSPLVFGFMNQVAELATASAPGRYLGCLAYFWCENPPPFPVHERVIPYVTTDRSQYYDRAYRAADLELMSRWGNAGGRAFGLWEYAQGGHFLVPRVPNQAMADAVREGWNRGARGYFAEIGPQWGFDASKIWMLTQLLWEPDRSPGDLLDDFYAGFFGHAAAPMRRFFESCEALWMAQSGSPYWLKLYRHEDQALLFPVGVCQELRGFIEAAKVAVASHPHYLARVELTSKAFAVTEAYVRFDAERRHLGQWCEDDLATHPAAVRAVADSIERFLRLKADVIRRFADASRTDLPAMTSFGLEPFLRHDPVPRLLWVARWRDSQLPHRILEAVGQAAASVTEWVVLADALSPAGFAGSPNLTENSDFAEAAERGLEPAFLYPRGGELPALWEIQATPTEAGRVSRVNVRPNLHAVRIEGAWDTQAFQWHRVEANQVYVATARLRGNSSAGNDASLFMTFLTDDGKVAGTHRMQSLPKGTTPDWRSMALADLAPKDAVWVGIGVGASRQVAGDWLEAADVELRGVEQARRR